MINITSKSPASSSNQESGILLSMRGYKMLMEAHFHHLHFLCSSEWVFQTDHNLLSYYFVFIFIIVGRDVDSRFADLRLDLDLEVKLVTWCDVTCDDLTDLSVFISFSVLLFVCFSLAVSTSPIKVKGIVFWIRRNSEIHFSLWFSFLFDCIHFIVY